MKMDNVLHCGLLHFVLVTTAIASVSTSQCDGHQNQSYVGETDTSYLVHPGMCYNYILKVTYMEQNFTFTLWALPAGRDSKCNEMRPKISANSSHQNMGGVDSRERNAVKVEEK